MSADKKLFHILFTVIIITIFIFKWNDFHLPYFWDELGVYMRAIDYQYHHSLSLMPASLPARFSRGHPLLFTFMNAGVDRIFGEGLLVEHLFCFSISILLLLSVYLKISRYFNPLTGFAAAFIIAIQPLFLAQSCLVLPEITLTFFIFLALCAYYENRYWLFAILASMAILTKEAAIVLPISAISYSLLGWILTGARPGSLKLQALFLTVSPYIVFGSFLLLQKEQNGWYFFPLHIDSVASGPQIFLKQIHAFSWFLFFNQGRKPATVLCVIGCGVALLSGRWPPGRLAHSFAPLLALLAFGILGFGSMIDLYLERYITTAVVAFSILIAVAIAHISTNRLLVFVMILLLLVVSGWNLESNAFHYDADLGYRQQVNVSKQAVAFMETKTNRGEKIIANFPMEAALSFKEGGYLDSNEQARNVPDQISEADSNYYLIICDPGAPIDTSMAINQMKALQSFDDKSAHIRIYQVARK